MSAGINIQPKSNPLSATAIKDHIEQMSGSNAVTVDHDELLQLLIDEIEQVDFKAEAYPEYSELLKQLEDLEANAKNEHGVWKPTESQENKMKVLHKQMQKMNVKDKELIVISIDVLLEIAAKRKWNLCKNNHTIFLYNGAFWKEIEKEALEKFLGDVAEKMGIAKTSARHHRFKSELVDQFLSAAYLPKPKASKGSVLINLLNGTYEIKGKKRTLRNPSSKDFITYQLPFKYEHGATAPLFKKYLDRVLPDASLQKVLAEYLGYVFIKNGSGLLKLEKALILYGSGANGKSVFYEVVNALLGPENTSNFSLSQLTDERGNHRAGIQNKLVNYASEINGKMDIGIFKQLVSGEPVGAKRLYKDVFHITEYAKLIFNCNELPKDVEQTNAFYRRFLIVPFNVTIPKQERDRNLHTKIINTELSGVFNWMLEGLDRLMNQKDFTHSEAAENEVSKYRMESDSVLLFLDEKKYQPHTDNWEKLDEIYTEYKIYCQNCGMPPVKKSNFKNRLESKDYNIDRKNIGLAVYIIRA